MGTKPDAGHKPRPKKRVPKVKVEVKSPEPPKETFSHGQ